MLTCVTHSPAETAGVAAALAEKILPGTVIALTGDLGAGKTLFSQGLAKGLGVQGEVTSPTFSLMNIYRGKFPLVHFDLYRLTDEVELEDIGFYEYADAPDGIVLIEWADKFLSDLPEDYLRVDLVRLPDDGSARRITFSAVGEGGARMLKELGDFCRF